jgi:hypothetical protein
MTEARFQKQQLEQDKKKTRPKISKLTTGATTDNSRNEQMSQANIELWGAGES